MLEKIKVLLGLTSNDKDTLLNVLLENAIDEAVAYTHNNCLMDLENAIIKMVIYNYNRIHSEGLKAETYSGMSFTYADDYPENIMRVLRASRKVIMY